MGAILITSREYYNFAKDESRKGDTVKPFTDDQSWELLLKLLGEDWEKADRENTIPQSEIVAAKKFLSQLEGLALAVRQAAVMIKDPNIGGPTIAKTYEKFKERMRTLPPRHSSRRSASEIALDSLWDMTFSALGAHARTLLSVFSWLSPGKIQIFSLENITDSLDRFYPRWSFLTPQPKCARRLPLFLQASTKSQPPKANLNHQCTGTISWIFRRCRRTTQEGTHQARQSYLLDPSSGPRSRELSRRGGPPEQFQHRSLAGPRSIPQGRHESAADQVLDDVSSVHSAWCFFESEICWSC